MASTDSESEESKRTGTQDDDAENKKAQCLYSISNSRAELINAHRDLACYYSNFGFFDSSNPYTMFERVFRPSIVRCNHATSASEMR